MNLHPVILFTTGALSIYATAVFGVCRRTGRCLHREGSTMNTRSAGESPSIMGERSRLSELWTPAERSLRKG